MYHMIIAWLEAESARRVVRLAQVASRKLRNVGPKAQFDSRG